MSNQPDLSRWQHSHSFGQEHRQKGESRTLLVIVITATMMVVEIGAGIAYGSMALLADGMHMASHVAALGINVFAYKYARRHAHDSRFSFGTGKVNALGGFTGALLLALFAAMMAWESLERFWNPTEIHFNAAIFVAVIGLIVNGASVFILGVDHDHGHSHGHDHRHEDDDHDHHACEQHNHTHHDHNLRSAYLHVLADALTSLTAIVALLAAKYFGWIWMDPLMGIVGSVLVAKWSIGLLKQTSRILLDHQATQEVTDTVRSKIEGDRHSHISDLHIWMIAPNRYAVIISVVSKTAETPDCYRARLDSETFAHITVEINSMS